MEATEKNPGGDSGGEMARDPGGGVTRTGASVDLIDVDSHEDPASASPASAAVPVVAATAAASTPSIPPAGFANPVVAAAAAASEDWKSHDSYNFSLVSKLCSEKKWIWIELYVRTILQIPPNCENLIYEHPGLLLDCRRAHASELLQNSRGVALQYFDGYIHPMLKATGPYVCDGDIPQQINDIAAQITNGQLSVHDDIGHKVDDYMRLYFPERSCHTESVSSDLWQFAKVTHRAAMGEISGFQCLACGLLFENKGILSIKSHIEGSGKYVVCPKRTANMIMRLNDYSKGRRKTLGDAANPSAAAPAPTTATDNVNLSGDFKRLKELSLVVRSGLLDVNYTLGRSMNEERIGEMRKRQETVIKAFAEMKDINEKLFTLYKAAATFTPNPSDMPGGGTSGQEQEYSDDY